MDRLVRVKDYRIFRHGPQDSPGHRGGNEFVRQFGAAPSRSRKKRAFGFPGARARARRYA